MKLLVLGAGGMAGHVISTYLSEQGHEVDTISARNRLNDETVLLDLTNKQSIDDYFSDKTYDAIINAVGVLVKQSEDRKDLASYLNAYLPHYLEEKFKKTDTKIIHLSTDCVFSGKNAPYYETSLYDGEIFYDRSKALGEIINDKDLTFRMSIIGPDMQKDGVGLFNWFYAQRGDINGYSTAMWNGITTIELAKGIHEALEQKLTGLYHLVPQENISKYNLLKLFAAVFNKNDIIISPTDSVVINKTLINTRSDFDHQVPTFEQMIQEMKTWIDNHKHLYPHYEKEVSI